jgi:hypothetical protein
MCAATSSTARCAAHAGALDLALYIVFFLPGIAALIYAGYDYRRDSWRIGEHSNVTATGPPIYHFKTVIRSPAPGHAAGRGRDRALHRLPQDRRVAEPAQGRAEIDVVEEQLAHSEYVDEESRKSAIERRARDRRGGAPARHGGRPADMSDPALGLLMLTLIVVVIMMGFPDGVHADGPRHVLRLHRASTTRASLDRQPRLRPDGPAHLRAMTNDV